MKNTTEITRQEALKLDNGSFYVDCDEDDNWYVFGTESGFAYASAFSKLSMEQYMNYLKLK